MRRSVTLLGVLAQVLLAACAKAAAPVDSLYSIEAQARPARLPAGGKGAVDIRLRTRTGAHLSEEAPLKVSLRAQNLALARDKLTRADAQPLPDGRRFEVPFTAGASGAAALEAEVVFFICTEKLCERQSRTLRVPVTVQ